MALPASVYTQWYWKVDLHNLMHFLRLRADVGEVDEALADWWQEFQLADEARRALDDLHADGVVLLANARGTRIKLLVHDGFGVWCAARRLNAGHFTWASITSGGPASLGNAATLLLVDELAFVLSLRTLDAKMRSLDG